MTHKVRDIRSSKDWEDVGDIRYDQSWMKNVDMDEVQAETESMPVAIPMQTDGGVNLTRPDGTPMAMRGQIAKTRDEVDIAWAQLQKKQPCWMCRHFIFGRITRDEKLLLLKRLLVQEHGWTEDGVKGDLGSVDKYEYCRTYELLTHRDASCPRNFAKRDDL